MVWPYIRQWQEDSFDISYSRRRESVNRCAKGSAKGNLGTVSTSRMPVTQTRWGMLAHHRRHARLFNDDGPSYAVCSLVLGASSDSTSESISARSLSIKVRKDSRKIRSDKNTSLRSSPRNSEASHCRIVESSTTRTEAERWIPHNTDNSPRILLGPASVQTMSFP